MDRVQRGFRPQTWRTALPTTRFPNTHIDIHHYQIFSPADKAAGPRFNLLRAGLQLPRLLARLKKYHPVIVGEWSLTLGSRKLSRLSEAERRKVTAAYARLQLRAFQKKAAAWFFWTYKTEHGGTWSFRDSAEFFKNERYSSQED